jgi:hypothetical protein
VLLPPPAQSAPPSSEPNRARGHAAIAPGNRYITFDVDDVLAHLHDHGAKLGGELEPMRFFVQDRDKRFGTMFDEVFKAEGVEIIRTRSRTPRANAYAESVRSYGSDRVPRPDLYLERTPSHWIQRTT